MEEISSEFKYLVNPTDKSHSFQYDGVEYIVPPMSRRLLLKAVAEHGEKRSYSLTDHSFGPDGQVSDPGNAILKRCYCEDANVINPVTISEPIVVEKSKGTAADLMKATPLGKDNLLNPVKPLKSAHTALPPKASLLDKAKEKEAAHDSSADSL